MKPKSGKPASKNFNFLLAVLAAGTVLVIILLSVYSRANMPQVLTPEHVTTGNVGEYSALSIIAQRQGYFKKYGLDVTMKEYPSGPSAVADVVAGKIDMATAADYVGVTTSLNNPNLRILATQLRAESFFMAARRDHGIQEPSDLKGKKIGLIRDTAGEFYFGSFLILNQLHSQDVSTVYGSPDDLTTMLESGQIDAMVSFDPHIYDVQAKLGTNAVIWSMQGDEKLSSLLYGNDNLVKKHPEAVQRYLQALLAAQAFAQEHNRLAAQIVGGYLHYTDAYTARIWPRLNPDVSLDEYLLINLEEQARWAVANGVTGKNRVPNYLQVIYFNGLEAVDPDAVTIIH